MENILVFIDDGPWTGAARGTSFDKSEYRVSEKSPFFDMREKRKKKTNEKLSDFVLFQIP